MVKRPITVRLFAEQSKDRSTLSFARWARVLLLPMLLWGLKANAQDAPLISGGVGFLSSTNAGATTVQPIISPVAAVPVGEHLLVESRAYLEEFVSPENGNSGPYQASFFAGLQYLQLDYIATPKLTVAVGEVLNALRNVQRALDSGLGGKSAGRSTDLSDWKSTWGKCRSHASWCQRFLMPTYS